MSEDWQFWIVMTCIALAAASIVLRCCRVLSASDGEGACESCHGCATGSSGADLVQLDLSKPR